MGVGAYAFNGGSAPVVALEEPLGLACVVASNRAGGSMERCALKDASPRGCFGDYRVASPGWFRGSDHPADPGTLIQLHQARQTEYSTMVHIQTVLVL